MGKYNKDKYWFDLFVSLCFGKGKKKIALMNKELV